MLACLQQGHRWEFGSLDKYAVVALLHPDHLCHACLGPSSIKPGHHFKAGRVLGHEGAGAE